MLEEYRMLILYCVNAVIAAMAIRDGCIIVV